MDINERIQTIKNKITPLLQDYKVKRAGFFGSVLRQDFNEHKDLLNKGDKLEFER